MAELSQTVERVRDSHVCALIEHPDEAASLIPLFIRDGRDQREKVFALAGGAWLDGLRRQLNGLNLRTREWEAAGQLLLVEWTQVYACSCAGPDLAPALASVEQFFSSAVGHGRDARVRFVAQMDWVVSACGGSQEVADYERGVDRLVRTYAQPAVCVYDLSRLSGLLLIEILSTHRLAVLRGALVESPFYREPS
jgi:hypothetical protein